MPSGTQATVAVLCPSPIGNAGANGHPELEVITDTEDLFSDDDQHARAKSPIKSKVTSLLPPSADQGALTDTEDMDLSGDEDELVPEKKDLPMLEDLGLLPEPGKEIVNLTEGYVRNESPMLSDTEVDTKTVEGRHKMNLLKSSTMGLAPPEADVSQALTDVEDLEDSGDEIIDPGEEIETTLPAHYDDLGGDVKNTESMASTKPAHKTRLMVAKEDQVDSSEDEGRERVHRKPRRKNSGMLSVSQQEGGTTDIEELSMNDSTTPEPPRIRRKRVVRKTSVPKDKSKLAVDGDRSNDVTDIEYLSGEDGKKGSAADVLLTPRFDEGAITDTEDLDVSDEEGESIIPPPVTKKQPFVIPEPHNQRVKISEGSPEKEEEGEKTDEEGFELEEKEDSKPLVRRQVTVDMPAETVVTETLEVEEPVEEALTDVEDMDVDDKEEAAILNEIASNEPKTDVLNATLAEMESNIGRISKMEKVKDKHEELKKVAKEAEMAGLTLQQVLSEGGETDVEDLDDSEGEEKPPVKQTKKKDLEERDDATDVESLEGTSSESEDEKPIAKTSQQVKKVKRGIKRAALLPQISEVRFVDTATGPLSIIVTPGSFDHSSDMPRDSVPGVVFLETHEGVEDAGATDIEELSGDERPAVVVKMPEDEGPLTDVEELEGDDNEAAEAGRPLTPLPPEIEYTVLPSPKRELIHIKEDKHGVPQVTITKMPDDMLFVPQSDDQALTDTEDVYISEEEAVRIQGMLQQEDSGYELPDFENTEVVSSTNKEKSSALKVAEVDESGSTDVEELAMDSKPKRKVKTRAKLLVEEVEGDLTDVETLSDIEGGPRLKIRVDTPGGVTDTELFDTSDAEELEVPDIAGRDLARTPDVIREATVHRIITVKEGVDGDTRIEEELIAPSPSGNMLTVEKDIGGVTDEEDFDASGAEDGDDQAVPEEVVLPENEATEVQISQKTQVKPIQGEEKQIKDNLLLPEENTDAHTDIESLDGEGGNRDP